ncbi:unnamed protein product, partial [Prorocentrum cordatum]
MAGKKRQAAADGEGARASKIGLLRRGKASGSGTDPVACARCDEPVDQQPGFRGKASGRGSLPMHGCDQCYTGFVRHFQQYTAWQDYVERCREDEDSNKDCEMKMQADVELAASIGDALGDHGSVEVDVKYGQEISKTPIQLSKDQWADKGVSSTGAICQHPTKPYTEINNHTKTEVRMSTVKTTAAKAAAPGGEQHTLKQEITKTRQKQAAIPRGNAKVPTLDQLQDIATSEAANRGLVVPPKASGARRAVSELLAIECGGADALEGGAGDGDGDSQGAVSLSPAGPSATVARATARGSTARRATGASSATQGKSSTPAPSRIGRLSSSTLAALDSPAGASESPAPVRDRSRSPAPIHAAHLSSGSKVVPKATQGAVANDETRWEQLKQDAVIARILDGMPKCGRVCSLKRFKPQSPSIAIMAETLHKKAETATLLANSLNDMSWGQICAYLQVLSNEEVKRAYSFSQDLLRKYLQLAEPSIDQIADAILPVAACSDAFNVHEPKLSSMAGDIGSMVAVSQEIPMDIVVLPGLARPALVEHMQARGVGLTDQFSATMPGRSASVKDYFEKVRGAGLLLTHLGNGDPETFSDCAPHMALLVGLLTGGLSDPEWPPLSEAFGEHEPWAEWKSSFRRAASPDLQAAPKMNELILKLHAADLDEDGLVALESAISSIGHWKKTRRGKASPTLKAEQAVQDTIRRLATQIVDSSDALVNLDFLGKLEVIMHHFSVAADFALTEDGGRLEGAHARLLDKRNEVEICRSGVEILAAARKYLGDPTEANADALHGTLQNNKKVATSGGAEMAVAARTAALLHQKIELLRSIGVDGLVQRPEFSTLVRGGLLLESIGDLLMKTIKHDGDGSNLRMAVNMRGYDVRSNLLTAQLLEKFQCTAVDPNADYKMIKDAFDELGSLINTLPSTTSDEFDDVLTKYDFDAFKAFSELVAPWKLVAAAALKAYAESCVEGAARAADEVNEKLAAIAGGMADGSDWLDGFDGDSSDWAALYAHMRATAFRQTGISNKIKSLERELREKQADFSRIAKDYNVAEVGFQDARDRWQSTVAKANLTVTIASLARAVSAKGPQGVDGLQRNLDAMQAKSVAVESIPPALWAEVQRKLAQ